MIARVCPQCGEPARRKFSARDWNRRLTNDDFIYYQCHRCGLFFLYPTPDLEKFYPADYYGVPPNIGDVEREAGKEKYKIDLVKEFVTSGRLLEVGPSKGAFALLAHRNGFDVTVIERDQKCCEFLSKAVGLRVLNETDAVGTLRNQGEFDVIALWQVIEHLPDPWRFLNIAAAKLRDNGILVVTTPNPQAFQFTVLGRFWPHIDAPRHVQLIPSALLIELGRAAGLEKVTLTSSDADADKHNLFGWEKFIDNFVHSSKVKSWMLRRAAGWARVIRFIEHSDLLGSSYTLVFRKPS